MKISFVQTFLLLAVAILGLATAETQKLRGANVEAIANLVVLKNERDLRGLFEETDHKGGPTGDFTNVNAEFTTSFTDLILAFDILGLLNVFSEVIFAQSRINFNFFQGTGGRFW